MHYHSWSQAFRHQNFHANGSPASKCGRDWVIGAASIWTSTTDHVKIEIDASRESFPGPITREQTTLDIHVAVTDFQPSWIASLTLIPANIQEATRLASQPQNSARLQAPPHTQTSTCIREARRAYFRPLSKCRDSITQPHQSTKETIPPYTSYDT